MIREMYSIRGVLYGVQGNVKSMDVDGSLRKRSSRLRMCHMMGVTTELASTGRGMGQPLPKIDC